MSAAEVILHRSDPTAPLRMRLSVARQEYGIYFDKSEWNAMVSYALLGAGDMWIHNYLPLRFAGYARAVGIYTAKKRLGDPLVQSGRLQEHTLANSRAEAAATSNNAYIDLIIPDTTIIKTFSRDPRKRWRQYDQGPMNYSGNPVVSTTLSRITDREIERIGVTFEATLQALINNAEKTVFKSGVKVIRGEGIHGTESFMDRSRVGKTRSMRLTTQQRSTLGLKQRARSTPTTAPRSH